MGWAHQPRTAAAMPAARPPNDRACSKQVCRCWGEVQPVAGTHLTAGSASTCPGLSLISSAQMGLRAGRRRAGGRHEEPAAAGQQPRRRQRAHTAWEASGNTTAEETARYPAAEPAQQAPAPALAAAADAAQLGDAFTPLLIILEPRLQLVIAAGTRGGDRCRVRDALIGGRAGRCTGRRHKALLQAHAARSQCHRVGIRHVRPAHAAHLR